MYDYYFILHLTLKALTLKLPYNQGSFYMVVKMVIELRVNIIFAQ